jgi:Flp pilus assembly protein TadG
MRRNDRGANLVEMVLVMFLLLLLLAGIVDFGRAFNNYIIITNASREGARYGSHFPHLEGRIKATTIGEAADSGITLTPADITVIPSPSSGVPSIAGPGEPIRVTVEYQFATILGGIAGFDNLTLRSSTEMIVFGQDSS